MKRISATFLASVALLVSAGSASAQVMQAAHCDCENGSGVNYVGYHATDWQNCNSGHHGRNKAPRTRCIPPKAYPDSGWAPPINYPVNYDGAWYGSYHPQAWYGSPGGGFIANYPTVYQPNDTTQLGYSYHKVPTWQSRPGMIPPVPQPNLFHARGCIGGHCGHPYGHPVSYEACESCHPAASGVVYSTPDSQKVVRPAAKKQSVFSKMSFASFTEIFD